FGALNIQLTTEIPDNVVSNDEPKTEAVLFGGRKWGKKSLGHIRRQARAVIDDANDDPIGFNDNGYSDLGAGRALKGLKSILQQIHEYLLKANSAPDNLKFWIEGIAIKFDFVLSQSGLVEQDGRVK